MPNSEGWYTGPVAATLTDSSFSGISGCITSTYSGPDSTSATVSGTCTDNAGKSTTATSAPFQYEGSSPSVSVALSRSPDYGNWYTSPVGATLTDSSFSGIASCSSTTYSGPDSTSATVSGTCTDNAGKSTTATSTPLEYEASSPSVSAAPSRPPDHNGWYTSPVTPTLTDSSFSGIASCSSTTYSGPDSTSATVGGTCTDNAGKSTTATSSTFQYEASSPTVTVGLTRGPDLNGWYTHPVASTVTGTSYSGIASCTTPATYSGPDTAAATLSGSCTDNAGKTASGVSPAFQYDASGPIVSISLSRPPDHDGWYTHAVSATVSGASALGSVSCIGSSYSGPDATAATVAGSCTDVAGESNSATSAPFRYEASAPTITVRPARPPDDGAWYNRAVAAAVSGTSFSGIASCTGTTYSGPDTSDATVSGTCLDNAGKSVSGTSPAFSFDDSAPLQSVTADPADQSVALHWSLSAFDSPVAMEITRTAMPAGQSVLVYHGTGLAFTDRHLRDGVRYLYTLLATDQAGNVSRESLTVKPGPRLLGPASGALVTAPPLLSWTPVEGATYYNVQLYRRGKQILSGWPQRSAFLLKRSWRYNARRMHLVPGDYHWYVWPGYGRRKAARYGRLIGSSAFTVT
ncbi:MAG TPA: hypothetical protein VMD09_04235 [Solirubrobacteraceae bacterium]|nr:hypothetical protein [Solirubrobacteraceae bacterium]